MVDRPKRVVFHQYIEVCLVILSQFVDRQWTQIITKFSEKLISEIANKNGERILWAKTVH